MSVATRLLAMTRDESDPLSEVLRGLPFTEPEPVPGEDWARLRAALRLDDTPGQLLVTTIRDGNIVTMVDPDWTTIEAASDQGAGVYFGLSKVPDDWRPRHPKERGSANTCLPRAFIGVDFDLAYGTHSGGGIALDDAVAAIERFPVRPVAVVSSGGGLHVYYRLAGKADREALAWVGDRVNGHFGQATDVDAWDSGPTIDLARVLRVPGTLNHKGGGRTPVRLLHADPDAAPITRDLVRDWQTFDEVRRAQRPGSTRPARDVPKVRRAFEGETPWDQFNEAFADDESFAALLERLGADVGGTHVRMPVPPEVGYNPDFSARIHSNADDTLPLVTIHAARTAAWWACDADRQTFAAYDLLVRVFDGDRRATARYVRRHVLDDPAAWLGAFSWTPGDPPPVPTQTPSPPPTPREPTPPPTPREPTPPSPVQTDPTPPPPVRPGPTPPPARTDSDQPERFVVGTAPASLGDDWWAIRDWYLARPHCGGCCFHPSADHGEAHLPIEGCTHIPHSARVCRMGQDCTSTHVPTSQCVDWETSF